MPITPYHFGPGILIKSVLPESSFSLQVFILAQIVNDVQPGIALFTGIGDLHGWTHTYYGATICALLTLALWRLWERYRPERYASRTIPWLTAAASALTGTLSHVWIDSQYHAEMSNLTPGLLRLVERGDASTSVEILCAASAFVGLIILGMRALTIRFRNRHQPFICRAKQ